MRSPEGNCVKVDVTGACALPVEDLQDASHELQRDLEKLQGLRPGLATTGWTCGAQAAQVIGTRTSPSTLFAPGVLTVAGRYCETVSDISVVPGSTTVTGGTFESRTYTCHSPSPLSGNVASPPSTCCMTNSSSFLSATT